MRLEDIEAREVMPGYHGRFIHSERTTLVFWEIESNRPLPEHAHPHEQIVNILEGTFELIVDGMPYVLSAGDYFVIPPDVPHTGLSHTTCKILDVFAPVREDYR